MEKLQRVSRLFRVLFTLLFFLSPILMVLFWLGFEKIPPSVALHNLAISPTQITFNTQTRIYAILASLIPTSIVMYGLAVLKKLFRRYETGQVFTIENVKSYQRLAYTIFAWVGFGWLYDSLITYVLTYQSQNPIVAVTFSSENLTSIIVGCLILLIAWVMDEGYKLAQEQAHTI